MRLTVTKVAVDTLTLTDALAEQTLVTLAPTRVRLEGADIALTIDDWERHFREAPVPNVRDAFDLTLSSASVLS